MSALLSTHEETGNLERLYKNRFPGGGIVIGSTQDGSCVMAYFITGRSPKSRNRVLSVEESTGRVFMEVADPSKPVGDAGMRIYNPMEEQGTIAVVSNGSQTGEILANLINGCSHAEAIGGLEYKDDPPNFSPRISAHFSRFDDAVVEIGIVRRAPNGSCERDVFSLNKKKTDRRGVGWCITTHEGDRDPLSSFCGAPYPVFLGRSGVNVADLLWDFVDRDNRVAIAVKTIDQYGRSSVLIKNQYDKVR